MHVHGYDMMSGLNCDIAYMYSLEGNKIDDAGAQALTKSLQHCTNIQELK